MVAWQQYATWDCSLYGIVCMCVYGGGCVLISAQDKVQAARALVAKLRSVHGPLVRSTERLCEAYIELAYHDSSVDRPKNTQSKVMCVCKCMLRRSKAIQ